MKTSTMIPLSDLPQDGRSDELIVNASGLKLAGCDRRWQLTVQFGISPYEKDKSALVVGKLVHKYAETMLKASLAATIEDKEKQEMAALREAYNDIAKANLDFKGIERVKQTLAAYPMGLPKPLVAEKFLGVEYKFHYVTDSQVHFQGTLDYVIDKGSYLAICDWKTTRVYEHDKIYAKYKRDVQSLFYATMFQTHAYDIFPKDLWLGNRAWNREFVFQTLPIQLTTNPPRWMTPARAPEWSFSEDVLNTFKAALGKKVNTLIDVFSSKTLAEPNGMSNNSCAGCPFIPFCYNEKPADEFFADAEIKKYEPLTW
jgi:hypothetical protein